MAAAMKCSFLLVYHLILPFREAKGAFFWDYSGYSYSGLGITEYTEFQFRKERQFWKRNTHGGGDLRTTMSAHARAAASDFPPKISRKNAYNGVFCLFRVNRIPFILFILLSGAE